MYKNKYRILELYLSDWKRKYYLREISYKTGLLLRTVQNITGSMVNENILHQEYKGRNKYYSLNLNNIIVKYELMITEIERTKNFLKKYKQFQLLLKQIKNLPPILIFGSYAENRQSHKSDIDILVISNKEIEELNILPHELHIITINNKTFVKWFKKEETLLKEILRNHIFLNHHYYFIDLFWWYYVG